MFVPGVVTGGVAAVVFVPPGVVVVGASYRESSPETVRLVTGEVQVQAFSTPDDAGRNDGDAGERPLARPVLVMETIVGVVEVAREGHLDRLDRLGGRVRHSQRGDRRSGSY